MAINPQICADLARDAYNDRKDDIYTKDNNKKVNVGGREYKVLDTLYNWKNGFYGAIYQDAKTNEVIVAFRGTEPKYPNDLTADAKLLLNKDSGQIQDAYNLVQTARDKVIDYNKFHPLSKVPDPYLTGHSLGGALVQANAVATGLKGATFNTLGIAGVDFELNGQNMRVSTTNTTQVINHVSEGDRASRAKNIYGQILLYPNPKFEEKLAYAEKLNFGAGLDKDRTRPQDVGGIARTYLFSQGLSSLHSIDNFVGSNSILNNQPRVIDPTHPEQRQGLAENNNQQLSIDKDAAKAYLAAIANNDPKQIQEAGETIWNSPKGQEYQARIAALSAQMKLQEEQQEQERQVAQIQSPVRRM